MWTYEGPPHVGAMRIASSMEGLHYVLHAPQGDTYADLLFTMIERRGSRPPVTYTTFQARDLGGDTAELVKTNIKEDETLKPVLSYSTSKAINENQLKKSGKNYIILRLGSVYGYSTDTARIDIMANFFSKVASQNGTLKLFAGGRQVKSLVPLIDVARWFRFMEQREDLKSETFNSLIMSFTFFFGSITHA